MVHQETECRCTEIMLKDPTRHFRGCPKRAEYPTHEAERRPIQKLESVFEEQVKSKHELLREMVRMFLSMSVSRPSLFDWSLQGFGMFRLYISKRVRLHVWDDRFAVPGVTTIHSHPWHFRSTVISGKMTDRLYEVRDTRNMKRSDERLFNKQQIVCGPGGGVAKGPSGGVLAPEPVYLSLLQEVTIEAGASYGLTSEAFHESVPEPGTVTIIEREFLKDTEHAYVCFPHEETWMSAEPREALPKEVEAMAERALAKLG
jgi:hypothetical protein